MNEQKFDKQYDPMNTRKTRPHIRDVYSSEQAIKLFIYTFLPSNQYAPNPIDLLNFNLESIHVLI